MPTYDTRNALWASHSAINEYLRCPRAYYLHYIYRDPKSKHKITLVAPALSLGQVVHDVVESLSSLPTNARFKVPLPELYEKAWTVVAGKRGGFEHSSQEEYYKERGLTMMRRLMDHPGPLATLAVRLKMELPYFWLSQTDNIILCGRIDWMQYLPDTNSVHIIDFKTSTKEEKADSLQLPIYILLAGACQKRPVSGASYWYLESDDNPKEQPLPDLITIRHRILKITKEMSLSKKLNRLRCKEQGCSVCKPYEAILKGEAEFLYTNNRDQDVFRLPEPSEESDLSEIL